MISIHQDIADRHEVFWDLIDRFQRKLQPEGDHLIWTGAESNKGYGNFWIHERYPTQFNQYVRAHRFAYWIANGPFDNELAVDHLCHERLCCNPLHLQAVTFEENALEANHYRWHGESLNGVDWFGEEAPGVF